MPKITKAMTDHDSTVEEVEVFGAEYITTTKNGNPVWRVDTSKGAYRTEPDASLGYGIRNFTSSRFEDDFIIGNPRVRVDLVLNKRGRVIAFVKGDRVMM